MLVGPYAPAGRLFTNERCGVGSRAMRANRRHRIVAFPAPWLAASEPFQSKPAAAQEAVRFNCFKKVARARRLEATTRTGAAEKRERGRDRPLVDAD